MIMSECYLDNSATTKPCKKAVENMLYALETCWGNPSSLHDKGIEADELLLKARKAVASALSANEKEIYFTSGGTEGNNLAIFGAAYKNRRKGNRVITTAVERVLRQLRRRCHTYKVCSSCTLLQGILLFREGKEIRRLPVL